MSVIDKIEPIEMNQIKGKVACAKRGGPNFVDSKRVDPKTLKCPYGYVPCSEQQQLTDTICVLPVRLQTDCPIIDLFVTDSF